MPVYQYRGLVAGNRKIRGIVDADSLRGARQKLRAEGVFPTELFEGRERSGLSEMLARLELPEIRRVPPLDLSLFTSQLATLISARIPVVESLAALTAQVENTRLKTVTGRLRESVNHGSSLADAMGEHPAIFSELYRSMVEAGESAGALELVLTRLADYVQSQMELRNKVISAMLYPLIMLGVSMVVVGVLMVVVIPTIAGILEDLGQDMPLPTMVVIAVSGFVTRWWLPMMLAAGVAFLVGNRLVRTREGRMAWDRFRLRLPLVGRLIRHISISRFSRTLATLLSGGLTILQALEIAKKVSANAVIAEAVDDAKEAITQGASIAAPLRQSGQFPPMVIHMIAVGEASGELATMLGKVSETYDELVQNALNRFTALMGPALLILVALVVVIVILSILLPIMSMTSAI